MSMQKGNINNAFKGWLVGQFFPDDSPFQDKNVEIYYKNFPVGDIGDKLHVHPQGTEYLIVLSGKFKMRIGEDEVILEKDDYIKIPNGLPDKIIEVLEPTTIIGLRYPSVPNNKTFLE